MFLIVTMKLIDLIILDALAIWSDKIPISTEGLAWAILDESGGYNVQPVPTPGFENIDINKSKNAGGNNQKLKLFIRGNAISGAPTISGNNQFLNPLTIVGITKKKIITNACAVTIVL